MNLKKLYKKETGNDWKMSCSTEQPTTEYVKWIEEKCTIADVSKRLFTYQEMLDVFTNLADKIDTSRFYTSDDELREELEPYVKQQIKLVLNVC